MRTPILRSLGLLLAIGCSSDGDPSEPPPSSAGGATGGSNSAITGGVTGKGGTTGGTPASTPTGGTTSKGGAPATNGGNTVAGGSGGSGGAASAGAPSGATGGSKSAAGGAGGMAVPTGGAASAGAPSGGAAPTGGSGSGGASSSCGASGFHVKDGKLLDVNCEEFVMRGVNYPYAWFSSRNVEQDLQAIAATGANAVRIVLATGGRWTKTAQGTLTSLIGWAKAAKLVSIVEVHDTTGYSEQMGSVELGNATSYWTGSDIVSALKGQEAFVILNIGNEPNGNNTSTDWAPSHVTAVQALRAAGLGHTLMVDAPNWGQDWENRMRDGGGSSIWDADIQKNLVFSVHMYDVYGTSSTVTSYFNNFLMKYDAPLVVGEFAADHGSSGNVDEDTIMSLAESLSVGYLGWSWAGNGDGLGSLDITSNFDSGSLTTWGTRLIRGMNGIEATSETCTCFGLGSRYAARSRHKSAPDAELQRVLVTQLGSEDEAIVRAALPTARVSLLTEPLQAGVVSALVRLTGKGQPASRRAIALEALNYLRPDRRSGALSAFQAALDAEEPELLSLGLLALSQSRPSVDAADEVTRAALGERVTALLGHGNPGVRGRALLVLAELPALSSEKTRFAAGLHALLDREPYVSAQAADLLARTRNAAAIYRLIELVRDLRPARYELGGSSGVIIHDLPGRRSVAEAALFAVQSLGERVSGVERLPLTLRDRYTDERLLLENADAAKGWYLRFAARIPRE
jgi:mannan endo-1,4-beta-mannosidase